MSSSTKPEYYTFEGSVWAVTGDLALVDLGYTDQVERKRINVLEGENLKLDYLKKTPAATVPLLLTPDGTAHDSTHKAIKWLINNAPAGAKYGTKTNQELIDLVHQPIVDPNFFSVAAKSAEELNAKRDAQPSIPVIFFTSRQKVIDEEKVSVPAEYATFYKQKDEVNSVLVKIYTKGAPDELTKPFFEQSQANWDAVNSVIYTDLPKHLPESGFVGGADPGEADWHVAAWIGRIGAVFGAKPTPGGWETLSQLKGGEPVPKKVQNYWDAWANRESWKSVYASGLH